MAISMIKTKNQKQPDEVKHIGMVEASSAFKKACL